MRTIDCFLVAGSRPVRSARGSGAFPWCALFFVFMDHAASAQAPWQVELSKGTLRPVLGTVWLVPEGGGGTRIPQPSIQAAVDAAGDGDTVLLSDGLFRGQGNHSVYVSGKDITIRSENGASQSRIDCERRGRAFLFDGPEVTEKTLLRGVTILRGEAPDELPGNFGGGVLANANSLPTIEACTIMDCSAEVGGGIAYFPIDAGVMGQIRDCIIRRNFAGDEGGGIACLNTVVDRCLIMENAADCEGGGVVLLFDGVIRNSLIARNTSLSPFHPTGGGGLQIQGIARLENCTIVENAALFGGGVQFLPCATSVVSNCILWGNQAQVGKEARFASVCGPFFPTFRHCNIQGGAASIVNTSGTVPSSSVIALTDHDPLFVDSSAGDYHLSAASPLIDSGDPQLASFVNEGDLDAHPRRNGFLDLGADEHYPGLAQTLVLPGRAGEANSIAVTGADPGELVFFFSGLEAGTTSFAFGACPTLSLEIADACFLGASQPDVRGVAFWSQLVPAHLSGTTTLQQAIGFDPFEPSAGCSTSNLVPFAFP